MKNKPKPASRPKKQPKSPLIKIPAVKAALLGNKKKPTGKTDKKKIGTLDNANLHKIERELRETKDRLRLLSEAAEEGIAIHDKGIILDANDALARIFGYELSEIIGMKAERLSTPETWKVIRKHIATKYNKPYEGVGVRKDGSTFICSLVGKPYKYKGRTLRLSTFHDITAQKQSEEILRNYLSQLNNINENLADGMVYQINSGKDGTLRDFSYLSPAVERLHGVKVDEATHHPELIYGQILKEDLDSLIEAETSAFRNQTKLDWKVRVRIPSGEIRWRHFLSSPRQLSNGDIVWDGIEIDITERKLTEDKLADEHRQLNYILDATKTRIDIIDSNFNLHYVDDPWQKIYGDPTGRKCYEYFMGRKSPCDNCGIPKALDSRQVVITEEVLTREGNRCIEVHTIPFQNKEGEWLVAEFNMDISARKEAEEALRQSENKYRLLTEKISDIVWIQDMDLRTIYVTPSIQTVLGFTPEERMNQTVEEQLTPDSLSFVLEAMAKELALEKQMNTDPQKHVTFVLEFYHKDGSTRWLEALLSGLRNDQGVLTGIHGVGRDITERKKVEEELKRYREHLEDLVRERTIKLEAANKELEAFSYSASHDLRAPLRSIDGFSKALLEDCEDKLDTQGKDYLIRIRAAIKRMAELIEDLMQLSRITRTEMEMEKINLTRIARLIIDELQKSQPQRIVDTRIAEGMEETADSKLMRIVLENLLGNAWKFTEKQAKAVIEFGCTKKGEKIVYFIRDNGVGFDMDYVDKLFAPFQRLHTEEEFQGTGIGLATVRRIIHRHGGKIWTEGQTGKGATFYFSLNEK